uniref:Uncharacterized protein n=1 Tax=Meloidogyne hapla TaxID=6305 RepID=A0A1I8B2D5_MELHA
MDGGRFFINAMMQYRSTSMERRKYNNWTMDEEQQQNQKMRKNNKNKTGARGKRNRA